MGIWIGRYAIVGGDVQEHGPRLVERPRIRDDDSVQLLVLAEPIDARSDEFCGEIANAVAEMFARESASLTGGLLRALRKAHSNLEEWNRRSLREHGIAIGLTCVAIRDGVATIAQVGPGVVYISGPAGLERLSTDGALSAFPIGGSEPIDPQFNLRSISESSLLLLSGDVEHVLTPVVVGQAMLAGPERALAQLFVRTRGLQDVTAVLIAELDGVEVTSSASTTVDSETETRLEDPIEDRIDSGTSNAMHGASSDVSKYSGPQARRFPSLRRPRIVGRRAGPVGTYLPWRTVGIVLVAVIIIAAAGRFAVGPILEQDRGAQLSEAVAVAELHLAALSGAPTVALRRSELEAALTEISRARSLNEADIRVVDLATRAAIALEALDAVVEVNELRLLVEFAGTITAPFEPTTLVSGGGLLWLLDGARGRVFAIGPLNGLVLAEVYRSGEVYEGLAAYDPISIIWDETESRLLILDTSRRLFAVGYTHTSGEIAEHIDMPRTLILRGADELLSVTAIATYSGNLYLLDSQGGEVWRYLPAGDGYDSERSPRLGGVEIEDTYGLMVDGDLSLLGEGGLYRFSGATPRMSLFQGIDHPLESPVAVAQDDARGLIYVADRSAHRIVSSSSDGEFLWQFRHNEFFDLRGLTLSKDGSEMYVLTGDSIVSFDPLR